MPSASIIITTKKLGENQEIFRFSRTLLKNGWVNEVPGLVEAKRKTTGIFFLSLTLGGGTHLI